MGRNLKETVTVQLHLDEIKLILEKLGDNPNFDSDTRLRLRLGAHAGELLAERIKAKAQAKSEKIAEQEALKAVRMKAADEYRLKLSRDRVARELREKNIKQLQREVFEAGREYKEQEERDRQAQEEAVAQDYLPALPGAGEELIGSDFDKPELQGPEYEKQSDSWEHLKHTPD